MRIQRSNMIGRLAPTAGRLTLGLLAATVAASAGCGQPRSFLDTSAMQQQSRDAERFWGPDGRIGEAPVAYHGPETAAAQPSSLLAQNGAYGAEALFPATYLSVPLPQSPAISEGRSNIAVVASPPPPSPLPEPVMTTAYEPAVAAPAQIREPASRAETVTYVAGRPRDDGLMLTSLEETESLPPLPPESRGPAASPRTATNSTADSEALPPLPPGFE